MTRRMRRMRRQMTRKDHELFYITVYILDYKN
jgi:hypothetical protein